MYAAAIAQGDNWTAKLAMSQAVAAKDDVAVYWMQLAKAELALGQYDSAHYAFSRASELDRANAEALQALADLSLMGGHDDEATRYADQVLVLQPGAPAPTTTKGFVALRAGRIDEAIKEADAVLAVAPLDTNATVLKARAVAASGNPTKAAELLESELGATNSKETVLTALLKIYDHLDDKRNIAKTQERLLALDPNNRAATLDYATALYDIGQGAKARPLTLALISSNKNPGELNRILALWLRKEDRSWAVAQAAKAAPSMSPSQRVVYAQFLIGAGDAAGALSQLQTLVRPPVTPGNANLLALLARAKGDAGQTADALALLNTILKLDDDNAVALRARADLLLRTGNAAQAVWDSQRLVAANPQNTSDRVRLATAYDKTGQPDLAEATYWRALNAIPDDPQLYSIAKAYLTKVGKTGSVSRVDQLYQDNRQLENSRW